MTREEIERLGIGAKLRLITGDIVEVKSVSSQDEMITFQYATTPINKATPKVVGVAIDNTSASGSGGPAFPVAAGTAESIKAERQEIGKTPTIVICEWVELASASHIG